MFSNLYKKFLLFLSLVLGGIIMQVACASPVLFLFPPTPTPTFTATPTFTRTFTPTPTAPVGLVPCLVGEYCPLSHVFSIRDFFPEGMKLQAGVKYEVEIPYAENIGFNFGWCAASQDILEQNLKEIEFVFSIDGWDYLGAVASGYRTNDDGDPCYFIGAVLRDWRIGETHEVKIGLKILNNISDGWQIYTPSSSVYTYIIHPILPTPTPTATFTPTRTPTRISLPAVYPTRTPPCAELAPLYIQNNTNGYVALNLNGVTSYSFWLAPGYQTLWICPGSYQYVASGCGGSSISGTMSAGEEHEFYCQ